MSKIDQKSPEQVHVTVSEAYAEALRRSKVGQAKTGCCGPVMMPDAASSCCGPGAAAAEAGGVATALAGYSEQERAIHADAAVSSFGCGNPLAFAQVQAGQTVLDLGSGAGFDLLIAAGKVGATGKVIGVDMTEEMITAARDNAAHAGLSEVIDVRRGTIEALPVDDGSVDWVISNCVINLSPDKPAVFAELRRVLKPGGHFSVSDIVAESLPESLRESAAAYAACVAGAISEADYVGGLRAAGLVDVEVTERLVYDRDQLVGIVGSDLELHGLPKDALHAALDQLVGQVWSAKIVGRRPACC